MLRLCLSVILSLFCAFSVRAQNDTTYFDHYGDHSDYMAAEYYRVIFPKEYNFYKYELRYVLRNRLKETGYYSSLDSFLREGQCVLYRANGYKLAEGEYKHGIQTGVWNEYFDSSTQKRILENFENGVLSGAMHTYYKSGNDKTIGVYKNGVCISYASFSETDMKQLPDNPYCTDPAPPFNMQDFISQYLEFPYVERKSGRGGRSVVSFVIDYDGSITDIQIAEHSTDAFDEEAIRVVKKMPKWHPMYQDGIPVKYLYKLPINFFSLRSVN